MDPGGNRLKVERNSIHQNTLTQSEDRHDRKEMATIKTKQNKNQKHRLKHNQHTLSSQCRMRRLIRDN